MIPLKSKQSQYQGLLLLIHCYFNLLCGPPNYIACCQEQIKCLSQTQKIKKEDYVICEFVGSDWWAGRRANARSNGTVRKVPSALTSLNLLSQTCDHEIMCC